MVLRSEVKVCWAGGGNIKSVWGGTNTALALDQGSKLALQPHDLSYPEGVL